MVQNLIVRATAPMVLGRGMNLLTRALVGDALQSKVLANLPVDGIPLRESAVSIIRTTQDIDRETNVSAEARGAYDIFSGSVSHQQKFKNKITRQATHVLVRMPKVISYRTIASPALSEVARGQAQNPKNFRKKYGDLYARGHIMGGELTSLLSITTEDKTEQDQVATELQGSLLGYGEASVSLSELQKNASTSLQIQMASTIIGGKDSVSFDVIPNITDTDINGLLSRMRLLEADVQKNPVPVAIDYASYDTIKNFPDDVDSIDVSQQMHDMVTYTRAYDVCSVYINDIEEVIRTPQGFINPPSVALLREWQQYFEDKKIEVKVEALKCAKMQPHNVAKFKKILEPQKFKLPNEIGYLSPEESKRLGQTWRENETRSEYKGLWRRKGNSRFFDASWTWEGGARPNIDANLKVQIISPTAPIPEVTIVRVDKKDKRTFYYSGQFTGPNSIAGTMSNQEGKNVWWNATIDHARDPSLAGTQAPEPIPRFHLPLQAPPSTDPPGPN